MDPYDIMDCMTDYERKTLWLGYAQLFVSALGPIIAILALFVASSGRDTARAVQKDVEILKAVPGVGLLLKQAPIPSIPLEKKAP